MSDFKSSPEQKNKTAIPVQSPEERSSQGEMEYVDSRESAFQLIQLKAAADDQGKRNRITQLQSKAALLTSSSKIAQLQAMSDSRISLKQSPIVQREENKTGLPDGLKLGMESISGLSLNDVKVHRNSDKPAQLQAHAYAQGTDIHLGPGQEKHLSHELGHVVQQKEGRVKPNVQLKDKVSINDDSGLEKEADVLGANAQKTSIISEVSHQTALNQKMELEEEPLQGKFIQDNLVQLQPFADLPPAEKRADLNSTKSKVDSAAKLTDIGEAIENSKNDTNKDDAVKRLKNTDTGVDRARTWFDSLDMNAEKEVFIEDRYPLALSDQKTIISKKLETILTNTDDTRLQEEANFNNLQSSANREGDNSAKVFKPEVLDGSGLQKTVKVASKGGGLSKVVGVGDFWDKMDPALQQLWINTSATAADAKRKWLDQTIEDGKIAYDEPKDLGGVPAADFKQFSSLAAAFPKPITGCWGITKDYEQFTNMEMAIKGLGLDPDWYKEGAFILTIPNTGLDQAVENAKDKNGGLGKASVFSSLMWKEFNYMEKIRETNITTSKTTNNDGINYGDGNTEVMAINLQASDFLNQDPTYLAK